MIKRITAIALTLALVLTLGGCGIREKIEEQIAEKVGETLTEGALNGAMDGEGKVDIEDGKVTIQGENGETAVIGGTEWPTGQAADLLPKFDKGTITSVLNAEDTCMIFLEAVESGDYDSYRSAAEGAGFSQNTFEGNDETSKFYTATKDENTTLGLSYNIESKEMTISVSVSE